MVQKRVAVLISGRGSNMLALADAARSPGFPATVALVIADRDDAAGLESAARRRLATKVVARTAYASREAHEAAVEEALRAERIELICLAGWMRLLSPDFVERWAGRLMNIHPSLLPLFPGLETHGKALEAGMRVHGATVHFVTDATDAGPIVAQAAVPVLADDTEASLASRVLAAEHRLYPVALRLVAEGRARMQGSRTVFSGLGVASAEQPVLLSPPNPDRPDNLEDLARFTP